MAIFEKSLKTLLDGSINIICAEFHLSNPSRFRKFAFDRYYSFSVKISEFRTPKGDKNDDFRKIVKTPVRWFNKHHLCLISPSQRFLILKNRILQEKITDGQTNIMITIPLFAEG